MSAQNHTADETRLNIVTGAFGFSGRYITRRLLARGERVRTLTNHTDPAAPEFRSIEVAPLNFSDIDELVRNMAGAEVLYNTYWVRFARGRVSHDVAVANSKVLIRAAEMAGIRRIVHVSITQPSLETPLPYFRGKAEVEEAIRASSLSWAILRPAVLFGDEDILINNIAWLLRRFPVFAVPPGQCRIQPVYADDLAKLAVELGHEDTNQVVDAVGPETYTYKELVRLVRDTVGSSATVVRMPTWVIAAAAQVIGACVHDVVLTRDEVSGLLADLLVSHERPTGSTSLRNWLHKHADTIGRAYASELGRHFRAAQPSATRTGRNHDGYKAITHRHAWW